MNISRRIKYLRKNILKLSKNEFALKLKMTPSEISRIEHKPYSVTDNIKQQINIIFQVSIDWLEKGIEPIFTKVEFFDFDNYCKENNITGFDKELLEKYLELPEDMQKTVLDIFKERFGNQEGIFQNSISTDET